MQREARPYLAECAGTFAVVFLGAAVACTRQLPFTGGAFGQTGIALAQGLIYAVALGVTLPISGGYLNPAVTLALWLCRRFDAAQVRSLLVAQVLGALLAGALVRFLFPASVLTLARLGAPHLSHEVFGHNMPIPVLVGGAAAELVLTFLLTFAIFGTIIDPRAPRLGGLGVGLALAGIVFLGFPLTGAGVNPVRWLGPIAWEFTLPGAHRAAFGDLFIYLVGPVLGALLAGWGYARLLLLPPAA